MRVHPSGLKHAIDPEDAIQTATWATWIEDLDDASPARQLRLGFDTRGCMSETVIFIFDSGNERECDADWISFTGRLYIDHPYTPGGQLVGVVVASTTAQLFGPLARDSTGASSVSHVFACPAAP